MATETADAISRGGRKERVTTLFLLMLTYIGTIKIEKIDKI